MAMQTNYAEELKARFLEAAEQVRNAPDWPQTQKLMVTGTYPLMIAMKRIDEGWSREEIATELEARSVMGALPNPVRVIGDNRVDDPQGI